MPDLFLLAQKIAIWAIPVLLAVTVALFLASSIGSLPPSSADTQTAEVWAKRSAVSPSSSPW